MNQDQVFNELKRMWNECQNCVKLAEDLDTPNAEDSHLVKIAIVGFSYHDRTENWGINHLHTVEAYMQECREAGHGSRMREYLALCQGLLLGLYSGGKIDDVTYSYGMAVLPGLAFGKGGERPY